MSTLSLERRQQLVKAAHLRRNLEIWKVIQRFLARLVEQPKLRSSRWIAANRGW